MAWLLYRNEAVVWVLEDIVIRFPKRQEMFLHPLPPTSVQTITVPRQASYSMNNRGGGALPLVKRPERTTVHSTPHNAESLQFV